MNQMEKGGQKIFSLMGLSPEKFATTMRADFRIAPVNVFIIVGIFVLGLVIHLNVYGFSTKAVAICLGSAVVFTVFLRCFQIWEVAIVLGTIDGLITYLDMRPESNILLITIIVAALLAPAIQIAYQWEKAVLLRFGKFIGLRKSGLFLMVPVIDKIAEFVDQRIRVSDFSAETTLTSDTVPVNVDAIAFWMVWDAQKAVLEVERFNKAVVLSAQTALRNAIGKHDLANLLSERDRLGEEIQKVLDGKTSAWGITTQSVEIAEKFAKASEHYKENPVALHLRAMNMVYEGLRQKGSMIIVPSTAVETMGLGALGGLTAFDRGQAGLPGEDPVEGEDPDAVT